MEAQTSMAAATAFLEGMRPINRKSDRLVIMVACYNRRDLLKRTLDSIAGGTRGSHEVVVIDGGSTDGTVEDLQKRTDVTVVLQGRLLGSARAYNDVWRRIESRYSCWLSDDTEVRPGALDEAVEILERHPEIGMVGLKMRDTRGPWDDDPYKTSLSWFGIANCNHGVLSTALARAVGYFNESYHSYTIDPDLTASVLSAGKTVVMTKRQALLHHREWSEGMTAEGAVQAMKARMQGIDNKKVYYEKFKYLDAGRAEGMPLAVRARRRLGRRLARGLRERMRRHFFWFDAWVIFGSRTISPTDGIASIGRSFHLVQRIPTALLKSAGNPYRHLVGAV